MVAGSSGGSFARPAISAPRQPIENRDDANDHRHAAVYHEGRHHGVFVDFNQNAKDRTVASAYSVRPQPDARVSAPVTWDELAICNPADFTMKTMPARFAEVGDPHAGIDRQPCSLEPLRELSARHERDGLGDAPWPPQYRKQAGEPMRVQPSRARKRVPVHPLIEIARALRKDDALAGLERWTARHPEAAAHLQPADVIVDAMRGRSSTWTRVRINLRHVPDEVRPAQERRDPDEVPDPPRRPSPARRRA